MIPTQLDPRGDDRAVSPVIGVILMVAITVILAAVIGSFVLGIGGQQEAAPQASITIAENGTGSSGNLTISHRGGDSFTTSNTASLNVSGDTSSIDILDNSSLAGSSGAFEAGDTIEVQKTTVGASGQVDVIWTGPQGSTQIIASRTF